MTQIILETERLMLRQLNIGDAPFIIDLLNCPGWLKFIGDRNVKTTDEAINYLIDGPIKSYRENGFGLSLVSKKADEVPIGMCGLLKRATLPLPDIGFALLPGFEGKGYAFEIASALLKHAKVTWDVSKICAITIPFNVNSIKLIEKLGLIKQYAFLSGEKMEPLLFYSEL